MFFVFFFMFTAKRQMADSFDSTLSLPKKIILILHLFIFAISFCFFFFFFFPCKFSGRFNLEVMETNYYLIQFCRKACREVILELNSFFFFTAYGDDHTPFVQQKLVFPMLGKQWDAILSLNRMLAWSWRFLCLIYKWILVRRNLSNQWKQT